MPALRTPLSALLTGLLAASLTLLGPAANAKPTWLPPVDVSEPPTDPSVDRAVDGHSVATGADGTTYVAWINHDDGLESVLVASRAPGHPSYSEPVEAVTRLDFNDVRIMVDDADAVTLVVSGLFNGAHRLTALRRPHPSSSFISLGTVPGSEGADSPWTAAVDSEGRVTVLWPEGAISQRSLLVSTWAQGSPGWTPAQTLDTTGTPDYPVLAVDGAGRATVAWVWFDDVRHGIAVASRPPLEAAFGAAETVTWSSLPLADVRIAANSRGALALAWTAAAPAVGRTVHVVSRLTESGGFTTALQTHGLQVSALSLGLGGGGEMTVAWSENTRVRTARGLAGEAMSDPEALPAEPATVRGLALGVDSHGGATLTWALGAAPYAIRAAHRPPGAAFLAAIDVSHTGDAASAAPIAAVDALGNMTVTWLVDVSDLLTTVRSAVLDAAGPAIVDVSVPGAALSGVTIPMMATMTEPWSSPSTLEWSFGDGATATGTSTAHTYDAAGTYTVALTATDAIGNVSTTTRTIRVAAPTLPNAPAPVPDTTAPALSEAKVRPKALTAEKRARLTVVSSESARLVGVVESKRDGRWRKVGKKRSWSVHAGSNRERLYAVKAQRRLEEGRYRLRLVAVDEAGNRSAIAVARFRVTAER